MTKFNYSSGETWTWNSFRWHLRHSNLAFQVTFGPGQVEDLRFRSHRRDQRPGTPIIALNLCERSSFSTSPSGVGGVGPPQRAAAKAGRSWLSLKTDKET